MTSPRTLAELFSELRALGPLRVISQCGPSTFEAICSVGPFGVSGGFLNAITEAYHWHVRVDGVGHVSTRDEIHARSGRRVLFFELRETGESRPFMRIYLYREPEVEFEPDRVERFAALHTDFESGRALAIP